MLKSFILPDQFSIFFEKNKIIGCRLFTSTFQPFRFAFFNSITNFLTICMLNRSLLFTIFSLYVVRYNSKWSENFQACSTLDLKNEPQKTPLFWTFFSYKCELVKCSYLFICIAKKRGFCEFKSSYLTIYEVEISKKIPHVFNSTFYKIL